MDMLTQDRNRGYLLAGIGAIVSLLAFLLLPYITITLTFVSPNVDTSVVSRTISLDATAVAAILGLIWLEGILALASIVLAALLALRNNPFGMTRTPVSVQARRGVYTLIGLGGLSIVFQFLLVAAFNGLVQKALGNNPSLAFFGIGSSSASFSYDIGSWLYLLGMLAVIGGGILAYRKITPSASPLPTYAQQAWPSSSQPYQGWQQPSQPLYPQEGWQQPAQTQKPLYPQEGWQQPQQPQQPHWQHLSQSDWQQPPQPPIR